MKAMFRPLVLIILHSSFCILPFAAPAATNDLKSLLQQGLFEEEANQNLDAAISDYQSLATKFDQDRQVAATAVFRLGECYRKLGKTNEAAAQYQRVLRDFPDQQTLATLSRQNLAGLGTAPQYATASAVSGESAEVLAKAAAAEAEAAALKAQLDSLLKLSATLQRDVMQQNFPNPVLTKLMQDLADAQQKLVFLQRDYNQDHPVYVNQRKVIDKIDSQINEQVKAMILAMQTKYQAAVETAKALRAQAGQSGSAQMALPSAEAEGAAPSTEDEDQELRRIRAMIQNSPDLINAPDKDRDLPLTRAAKAGWLQVARYLLDHGARVDATDPFGKNALSYAVGSGHKAMVQLLLDHHADVNGGWREAFQVFTPLNLAVSKNFREVTMTLLEYHADPNLGSDAGQRPLDRAAGSASKEIVELLLAHGAKVNATDKGGNTALHQGAQRPEIVALLLAHKADVNARNQSGETPLHDAVASDAQALKLLLAKGAEVNAQDSNGETPLVRAVNHNYIESVRALLEAKADPDRAATGPQGVQGWAPLHYAAEYGLEPIVKELLRHGAQVNLRTGAASPSKFEGKALAGATPLHLATLSGKAGMVKLLLDSKANPNLVDAENRYPLHRALDLSDAKLKVEVVKLLLEHGADVNARYPWSDDQTPLHVAVRSGSKTLVETLLAYKPDVNALDGYGLTALYYAKSRASGSDIVALLRAHGALDDLPRFDRIQVRRPPSDVTETVFVKSTNDWNRFTLFETLVNSYRPDSGTIPSLPFPDLARLVIVRHHRGTTNETRIKVDLLGGTNGIDCSRDVPLEFGDVVEIPEREHALSDGPVGLTGIEERGIRDCLKGTVQLLVRNQKLEIQLYPFAWGARIDSVLNRSEVKQVLLSSSDLSRVKVTRRDPATGKTLVWVLDCSKATGPQSPRSIPMPAPGFAPPGQSVGVGKATSGTDLWLRNGDVIEVPEK